MKASEKVELIAGIIATLRSIPETNFLESAERENVREIEAALLATIALVINPPKFDEMRAGIPNPTPNEIRIACKEGKINAIKEYRARTKLGLKESKEAIEEALHIVGLRHYGALENAY